MRIAASGLAGLVVGMFLGGATASAVSFIKWQKAEVIPVVLLKPGINGFEPTDGISFDHWSKDQVIPVVIVKEGLNGFEPAQGFSLSARWTKEQVKPVSVTKPAFGGDFEPIDIPDR